MLVGQVERKDFGRLALQEQNYSRLLADVTKLVIEVNEPELASKRSPAPSMWPRAALRVRSRLLLPEDIFDEEPRPNSTRRGRALPRDRAPRISTGSRRCWPPPSGRWCWSVARCWADAVHDKTAFADLNRLSEEWVLPISPTHRRPQTVRRDASELRRLYGDPGAAGA